MTNAEKTPEEKAAFKAKMAKAKADKAARIAAGVSTVTVDKSPKKKSKPAATSKQPSEPAAPEVEKKDKGWLL